VSNLRRAVWSDNAPFLRRGSTSGAEPERLIPNSSYSGRITAKPEVGKPAIHVSANKPSLSHKVLRVVHVVHKGATEMTQDE
jgi:hypothetical protein